MGTLIYNDANIPTPTVSDFEAPNVPTLLYSGTSYDRYYISAESIVYCGGYINSGNVLVYLFSAISTSATAANKSGSTFSLYGEISISSQSIVDGVIFYSSSPFGVPANWTFDFVPFDTYDNLKEAVANTISPQSYPITYRLTNATTTGPNEAAVGDTVTVPLTFPEGYDVVNPSSDAYVTCNGVLVPSTYSNGQLVFTMPDPS